MTEILDTLRGMSILTRELIAEIEKLADELEAGSQLWMELNALAARARNILETQEQALEALTDEMPA